LFHSGFHVRSLWRGQPGWHTRVCGHTEAVRGGYGPVSLRELLGVARYEAELAELATEEQRLAAVMALPIDVRIEFKMNPPDQEQLAAHTLAELYLAGLYNCGARTVTRQ